MDVYTNCELCWWVEPTLRSYKENNVEFDTHETFFERIDNWVSQSNNSDAEGTDVILKTSKNSHVNCGKLNIWLGQWIKCTDPKGNNNYSEIKFKEQEGGKPQCYPDVLDIKQDHPDLKKLLISYHFSWAGIHYLEKGGYNESASKEYLELSHSITTFYWWYLTLNKKNNQKFESLIEIIELSISCLRRAVNLSFRSKYGRLAPHIVNDFNTERNVNRVVNPEFITTAYSLYLLCIEINANKQCRILNKSLQSWGICDSSWKIEEIKSKHYIQSRLKDHLLISRYPMLNRLRGLSILIHSTYMNGFDDIKTHTDSLMSLTSTLLYYNDLYNSPFHFTRMESGLCSYFTFEFLENLPKELKDINNERWFKKTARKHLSESISVHTMGKTYYENITNLYYLYDDFNDRRIHMGHALQMLGTSYAQQLLVDLNKY